MSLADSGIELLVRFDVVVTAEDRLLGGWEAIEIDGSLLQSYSNVDEDGRSSAVAQTMISATDEWMKRARQRLRCMYSKAGNCLEECKAVGTSLDYSRIPNEDLH